MHQFRRCRAILIARHTERRHGDAPGLFGKIRIADGGAGAAVTDLRLLRKHVTRAGIGGILRLAEGGCEPAFHDRIDKRSKAVCGDLLDAGIPHLGRADLVSGVAEYKRVDEIGTAGIKPLRNQAADGQAPDDCGFHTEMIEQRNQVTGMIVD
ncbi:hypothetical protein D3C78_1138120 [compost metagenome]